MIKTEIIKSLKCARIVSPTPQIQDKILTRILTENTSSKDYFKVWQVKFAVSFILIFFVAGIATWQNPMNRANLSIAYAETMLNMAKSPAQLRRNESILDNTHKRLAELNLVGVPGLYSKDQCEQAYNKFYNYMSVYEHKLENVDKDHNFENIKAKIVEYELEASKKWPSK